MSSVRSIAGRAGPPPNGAWKSATTSIASVAEPPLPSASSRPPASNAARSVGGRGEQRRQRCRSASARAAPRSRPPWRAPTRARRRRPPRGRAPARRGTDRGTRDAPLSWTGLGAAALEQPAVLEEHVHELPQHVVGGLGQLLAHERIARRVELRAARQPRARRPAPTAAAVSGIVALERDQQSRRARPRARPAPAAARPRRSAPSAGSARLPTITGWTNSTATWRASERAVGERPSAISRPPRAKRSAARWQRRAIRVGLGAEVPLAGLDPLPRRSVVRGR